MINAPTNEEKKKKYRNIVLTKPVDGRRKNYVSIPKYIKMTTLIYFPILWTFFYHVIKTLTTTPPRAVLSDNFFGANMRTDVMAFDLDSVKISFVIISFKRTAMEIIRINKSRSPITYEHNMGTYTFINTCEHRPNITKKKIKRKEKIPL